MTSRPSRGLEQFFAYPRGIRWGCPFLIWPEPASKISTTLPTWDTACTPKTLFRTLDDVFGDADPDDQTNQGLIDQFLRQTLNFENEQFDGVLVWDVLQYMTPALLAATLERLRTIVRPKAYLLAYFHSDEKAQQVPFYSFRIKDSQNLMLAQRGTRKPAQIFNNRSLEKLFQKFESVKFFLTKEQLREVIVRR